WPARRHSCSTSGSAWPSPPSSSRPRPSSVTTGRGNGPSPRPPKPPRHTPEGPDRPDLLPRDNDGAPRPLRVHRGLGAPPWFRPVPWRTQWPRRAAVVSAGFLPAYPWLSWLPWLLAHLTAAPASRAPHCPRFVVTPPRKIRESAISPRLRDLKRRRAAQPQRTHPSPHHRHHDGAPRQRCARYISSCL